MKKGEAIFIPTQLGPETPCVFVVRAKEGYRGNARGPPIPMPRFLQEIKPYQIY